MDVDVDDELDPDTCEPGVACVELKTDDEELDDDEPGVTLDFP